MDTSTRDKYEAVIGLEIHAQMLTKTKAYSNDINEYGGIPNTHVSAISLGHPGTLPKMNKKTIEFAVRLGLACECKISENQYFARKNYFYPDLPKGYQITQDTTPICTGGKIYIPSENGEKPIHLTRIHMEEDAGKSIHDVDPFDTLIDLNRAGVPLLEIVSEPDIRSSKEAYDYITEVRKMVRYLDICDGNMEEGSLRCDANVSVRLNGATTFGTKVEVKNMNSMRNVQRAIEFEIERQIMAIEKGECILAETRSYDALKNITISMRAKESSNDYRYFPEPDLQPISISETYIQEVKSKLPPLPRTLKMKYISEYKLSAYDAQVLTDTKEIALYFEQLIEKTDHYKAAANWVMGEIKSYINHNGIEIGAFSVSPPRIAELIELVEQGKISHSVASQKIFPLLIKTSLKTPLQIAEEENLLQESNEQSLLSFIRQVMHENATEVTRYKAGEKQLIGFFMGQLMKVSNGKADPKASNQLLRKMLEE
jgi:aspartyl-tRNA(Asn)/glutamyl-tRNA(Gln) amidotransferase subunit B